MTVFLQILEGYHRQEGWEWVLWPSTGGNVSTHRWGTHRKRFQLTFTKRWLRLPNGNIVQDDTLNRWVTYELIPRVKEWKLIMLCTSRQLAQSVRSWPIRQEHTVWEQFKDSPKVHLSYLAFRLSLFLSSHCGKGQSLCNSPWLPNFGLHCPWIRRGTNIKQSFCRSVW